MKKRTRIANIRKLARVGRSSLGVTIPVDIVKELKLKKKQKVIVTRRGSQIIIKDWKP